MTELNDTSNSFHREYRNYQVFTHFDLKIMFSFAKQSLPLELFDS